MVKPIVEAVIKTYINDIRFTDEIVFHAKLEANILNCHDSIIDIGGVTMNESGENLPLQKTYEAFQVPVIGTIVVTQSEVN